MTGGSHDEYDELRKYYDIFCEIGGYLVVVKMYLETQGQEACKKVIRALNVQWMFVQRRPQRSEDAGA